MNRYNRYWLLYARSGLEKARCFTIPLCGCDPLKPALIQEMVKCAGDRAGEVVIRLTGERASIQG